MASDSDSENEVIISAGETTVRRWCSVRKLSQTTTDAVIALGYDTMEALSLLTTEDLGETIPVGQRRLLVQQVVKSFPQGAAACERRANNVPQASQEADRGSER
jgi:hypothetical protein